MLTSVVHDLVKIAWILLTVVTVHEMGHFAVAYALKLPISSVEVGTGARVFCFQWRGINFRWFLLPIVGMVKICWPSKKKWKNLSLFLGGPLANLVFALGVYLIYRETSELTNSGALMRVSVAVGLFNLIPFRYNDLDSDGYQILKELRR